MQNYKEKGFKDGENDNIDGVPKYSGFGKSVDTSKLNDKEMSEYSAGYEDGFNSGPRWQWQE